MFVELNDRVFLNTEKLTRIKIDEVQDGMRIRFYEGNVQVAKSKRLELLSHYINYQNSLHLQIQDIIQCQVMF